MMIEYYDFKETQEYIDKAHTFGLSIKSYGKNEAFRNKCYQTTQMVTNMAGEGVISEEFRKKNREEQAA